MIKTFLMIKITN